MKRLRLACLAGVVALFAAACGADDAPGADTTPISTAPPATEAGDPTGSWIAVSASLDGEPIALIDGWDVTVDLGAEQISGTAACNGYGGAVTVGEDGSFSVGEVAITEMGCQPDIQALEQSFVVALNAFDAYTVQDDTLTVSGGGHEWTFARLAPVDDAAIVGTTWVLDTYLAGDAATNTPAMADATLTLREDGTLSGSTGCRPLTGEWVAAGAEISVTSLTAIDDPTAGVCAPESEQLDNWVISVLEGGFTPTVEGNRLTIMAHGNEGLSYVAAE